MSKEWSQTPAQLMGLTSDPWIAWCVNEAVFLFGRHVDYEVESAGKGMTKAEQINAAKQRALTMVLTGGKAASRGQFRDPAARH